MTIDIFATTFAGLDTAHAVFGFQFTVAAVLTALLAAAILYYARRHGALIALACFTLVIAIFVAATQAPFEARAAEPPPALVAEIAQSARQRDAGERLFETLQCSGCHRGDGTGIGPVLAGRFGTPVAPQTCGSHDFDEAYVRESVVNPTAVVAEGFAPVMPSFAGRVSEEDLQALVTYLRSLAGKVEE